MDAHELESILTRRDLAAAESARDHVGPHSMFLANHYWRTQDWIERSLVVHMVQDQRGPHLRSLFSDFLSAPEPPAPYRDHVELTKAVCLVQLKGDLELFARYEQDREALRRDIQAELAGAPAPAPASAADAPAKLLGQPTPVAPPDPLPARAAAPTPQLAVATAMAGVGAEAGAPTTASPSSGTNARATLVLVTVLLLFVLGVALSMFTMLQPMRAPEPPTTAGPR